MKNTLVKKNRIYSYENEEGKKILTIKRFIRISGKIERCIHKENDEHAEIRKFSHLFCKYNINYNCICNYFLMSSRELFHCSGCVKS